MANKFPYYIDKNNATVYALIKSVDGGKGMVGIEMYSNIQKLKKLGYKKQRYRNIYWRQTSANALEIITLNVISIQNFNSMSSVQPYRYYHLYIMNTATTEH